MYNNKQKCNKVEAMSSAIFETETGIVKTVEPDLKIKLIVDLEATSNISYFILYSWVIKFDSFLQREHKKLKLMFSGILTICLAFSSLPVNSLNSPGSLSGILLFRPQMFFW